MKTCKETKFGNGTGCAISEKLIRVRAQRPTGTVFLRVHYVKSVRGGCTTLRILKVESVD